MSASSLHRLLRLLAVVVVVVAVVSALLLLRAPRPVRHLVIVSLDTLRADHLGAYGYARPTSPVFDGLAREGVLFERAVAQGPATLPSHGALLTGLYPSAYGDSPLPFGPPPGVPTLAEILKAHGFATWAFVDGGYLAQSFGLGRGFDHYEDRRAGLADILRRLDGWLDAHAAPRTFLFVHCYDIHTPYAPPDGARRLLGAGPWRGKLRVGAADLDALEREVPTPEASDVAPIVALYDGDIRATDDLVARLLETLVRHGLRDDAVIVVLSDHGEEFFEHGKTQHKQLYFAPNLHVPLLFLVPGRPPARIGTTVELVDVLPTALELLGLPPHPDAMGRSLVALMDGEPSAGGGAAYSEGTVWNATLRTLVTDRHQLFHDLATQTTRLYDVNRDPQARDDLAVAEPELTARLLRELHRRMDGAAAKRRFPTMAAPVDPETQRNLSALGYVE